jgi:hypothetical protein
LHWGYLDVDSGIVSARGSELVQGGECGCLSELDILVCKWWNSGTRDGKLAQGRKYSCLSELGILVCV